MDLLKKTEDKLLDFDSADENQELLIKCTKFWDGIKN